MNYEKLREELKAYYWHIADGRAREFYELCMPKMDAAYEESMSVFAMKRMVYRVITENMDPILFYESPFYYETGTLAAQCDGARDFRGHKNPAGWVYWKNEHLFRDNDPELFDLMNRQKDEKLYLVCGHFNDDMQHFCFNHRPLLKGGLKSVYEEALAQMEGANEHEKDFLATVCEGLLCIKQISEKFAAKAEAMLAEAPDEAAKARLARIADCAKRTPWEAPQSFFEALNLYAIMRKAIGSLEGIGHSNFGRFDMDLYPFYKKDLDEGKITKEEAYELIAQFLLTFDMHYDHDLTFAGYSDHELENTYVLGGCDLEGKPLCNDITLMCLRATREEKLIYPKPKLRYSSESPKEMLDEANKALLEGTSVILYQNDEATIPAALRPGRTLEEARDYLIFGCWGFNGNGYEKFDDGMYVNLAKPLELAVHRDFRKMVEIGMYFEPLDEAKSFEEVYDIMLGNIRVLLEERLRVLRAGAHIWPRVDVMPIFSSTMQCCLEKRKDLTEGGGKYRDDRNEIFAIGNVIDSLMAIKELCFDTKKYTLKEFLDAVRNNWEGCEEMRIDATRCHGWGDGNKESSELCARLNRDMDGILQQNTGVYGGKIVLAHFGYTEVRWWGEVTRATPDGRKNGDYLTQGLTPSRLTKIPYATSLVNSLSKLDGSLFGGSSVVNMMLPATRMTLESCEAFLRATAKSAAQSIQLNCVSREQLLDAQKHPEKYPDLIVRVTGFSAKFTSLSPEWQQEILTRNFYE